MFRLGFPLYLAKYFVELSSVFDVGTYSHWMNCFRRILVRWDKSSVNYLTFLNIACALIACRARLKLLFRHCSSSAAAGSGWAFTEIRQALAEARLMGQPPSAGLARPGRDLEISQLQELAASTALAGNEGAKVRASLSTKARSIRTQIGRAHV